MSDETNEGKILIFSPSGFILKLIFSIAMTAVMTSFLRDGAAEKYSLFQVIFFCLSIHLTFLSTSFSIFIQMCLFLNQYWRQHIHHSSH